MSTFTSHLHTISGGIPEDPLSPDAHQAQAQAHNNPHATANPVDMAALFRLVQDQMGTLARDAPNEANRELLQELILSLDESILNPPSDVPGVSQEYLDTLDRVPRKKLKADESCPICAEKYLDDQYPLVVELPCHHSHRFDLECVGPWLQSKGTCPLCRKDLTKKKEPVVAQDDEEDDDPDMLYA